MSPKKRQHNNGGTRGAGDKADGSKSHSGDKGTGNASDPSNEKEEEEDKDGSNNSK